jgi:drug/metabolite transporter (DMT)-like permease
LTLETNNVRSTACGVAAIFIWSTFAAVSRSLSEQIGVFTAAGYSYFAGGLIGMLAIVSKGQVRERFRNIPFKYYMSCGSLFLTYNVVIYLAIGLASNRQQVLGVTLVNYLWPLFILIFTIIFFQRRTRPYVFTLGLTLVIAGAYLATIHDRSISIISFFEEIITAPVPYLFAFIAAVSWGLYTVINKRWSELRGFSEGYLAVPLIFLFSGVLLLTIRGFFDGVPDWSFRVFFELMYQAVFVWLIAYVLWAVAAQRGSIIWLGILSLFMPLLSTLFTCLYLMILPGVVLWFACVTIILGAWMCQRALIDKNKEA